MIRVKFGVEKSTIFLKHTSIIYSTVNQWLFRSNFHLDWCRDGICYLRNGTFDEFGEYSNPLGTKFFAVYGIFVILFMFFHLL